MKPGLRSKVAQKANKFVKTAQAESPAAPAAPAMPEPPKDDAPKAPAPKKDPLLKDVGPELDMSKDSKEDIDEDEIKKDIKEDLEKDEVIEDLRKTVDDLGSKFDEVVDALVALKDAVLPEEAKEEELEEFKDKLDEEKDKEMSILEFGVEPESLIVSSKNPSKEAQMPKADLRKKRKARLLAKMKAQAAKKLAEKRDKENKTLSDDFALEDSKKKKLNPSIPAPQITKTKPSTVPSMLKLADLSIRLKADKSAWEILDKEDRVRFVIAKPEKLDTEKFATKEFAKQVVADMKNLGLLKALKKHKASSTRRAKKPAPKLETTKASAAAKISELMKKRKQVASKKTEPATKTASDTQEKVASTKDVRRQFAKALRLANVAMQKNLVNGGYNPLKASLMDFMVQAQLDPEVAQAVIETAFNQAGEEHFELALEQADKYMTMSDEAFIETEAAIGDLQVKALDLSQDQVSDFVNDDATKTAEALRARAARNSLPLTTQSSVGSQEAQSQALSDILAKKFAPNLDVIRQAKKDW